MFTSIAEIQPGSFVQSPLTSLYPDWQTQIPLVAISLRSNLQAKQRLELKLRLELT